MNKSLLPERLASAALLAVLAAAGSGLALARGGAHKGTSGAATDTWNPEAAAAYLDQRATWWITWKDAERDHGTFCVSCHTAVPYELARPALRKTLAQATPTESERVILDNVTKRVRMWKEVAAPYNDKDYGRNKEVESRATEAVLLAFVLANHDAQTQKLTDDTRAAFDNLWALQQADGSMKGAWLWQMFRMNPWEGSISAYHGATLAAVAVGVAPENYRSSPAIQKNLDALGDYLNREYSAQPLVNRATLLWAASRIPGLITPERQKSIIEQLSSTQREDGGWSLFPMVKTWRDWTPSALVGDWKRYDGSPQDMSSDGYATALSVLVLERAGISHDDPRVKRGRAWLLEHQSKTEGFWYTSSVNKRRDPASNVGRFMSDAATAYAVLALTN
jgi:squalene-hopene/tetraprenyl-beta-curcumene cyclase